MIARVWRGETLTDRADEYHRYLLDTGAAECTALPGNTGVQIWRRATGGVAEFIFISYWRTLEDIRAFAGDDLDRAVYYPKDHDFLLALDAHVRHFDVTQAAPNDDTLRHAQTQTPTRPPAPAAAQTKTPTQQTHGPRHA